MQEAFELASSSCGTTMDVTTCGFTPWGPESCPSLEQVMASTPAAAARHPDPEYEEERRRRQRRKLSNRLSARRSRARKQQRLEELRAEAARLRGEKRELEASLQALARHGGLAVRCQNARLRAEASALARRVREALRLLALHRLAFAALQPMPRPGVAPAPAPAPPAPLLGLASLMT